MIILCALLLPCARRQARAGLLKHMKRRLEQANNEPLKDMNEVIEYREDLLDALEELEHTTALKKVALEKELADIDAFLNSPNTSQCNTQQ